MFILLGHKGSVVGCDGGHGCSRRGGKGRWMRVVGVVHLLHDGPWEGAVGHPNLLAIYRVHFLLRDHNPVSYTPAGWRQNSATIKHFSWKTM